MTVTIKYSELIKDETILTYTQQWATAYGYLTHAFNIEELYGFSRGTDISNNKIAIAGFQSPYENEAIIIGGTLMGEDGRMSSENYIQYLEFGDLLIPHTDNTAMQLEQVQLKIDGLNIKNDFYNSVCSLSRTMSAVPERPYEGGEDQGTYNLLRGNPIPMLEILQSQGVDVNTPLKDLAIASQFDVITNTPVIDTVGTTDESGLLLVA
ncbi:heme acquisition protein HasA [Yersinia proxima]|uniref:Heme acquisition protein HasA n=1 Tax=Yersinia proxima TaxID=2890316 RepID=A0ABW9F3P1_9GAMM